MPVLKNKNKKKNQNKLVGAYLPPQVHVYLSYFALAKAESTTNIIKPLIENWAQSNQKILTIQELVIEISMRVKEQWKIEKNKNKELTLPDFKKTITQELLNKNISENHIKYIITNITT
jgi:hypothetical protein